MSRKRRTVSANSVCSFVSNASTEISLSTLHSSISIRYIRLNAGHRVWVSLDLGVKDKAYIIVGGTRGMGWAAAKCLAQDGARLALIGRSEQGARERAAELASLHATEVIGLGGDAVDSNAVELAIRRTIAEIGPIRGLLTTPGVTDRNGDLLTMTDADWEANFQNVMLSQVRSCRAILPHLIEKGGGTLVTTSAYSSRVPKSFLFGYASLKAALINFTKNLSKTYGAQGVRANCVSPGAIETDVLASRRMSAAKDYGLPLDEALEHVMFEEWKMPVALRSIGQPDQVGELMAFCLSERASYMTGAIINIDGGTDF